MRKSLTMLGLTVVLLCCKGLTGGLPSSPTATPSPIISSPRLPISSPLRVEANTFTYEGKPFPLLGSIICCSEGVDERGWPLINETALMEIAASGGNYTHIRLGPFSREAEQHTAIYPSGAYNDAFWGNVERLVGIAEQLGIFVEVDLIDGWALKTHNSYFGDCSILGEPPSAEQLGFVRKAVSTIGRYPNVLWQISNESGVGPCGAQLDQRWERGIAREILETEQSLGLGHRLIGTNCGADFPEIQNAVEMDYITIHDNNPLSLEGKRPLMVNEWEGLTPEQWRDNALEARRRGTYFMMWRSEGWTEAENKRALSYMKEIQSGS